jgi:hypothetical protein
VRSGSEEIRQSNCNAYINCYADLLFSCLLALLTNTYTRVYSCVLLYSHQALKNFPLFSDNFFSSEIIFLDDSANISRFSYIFEFLNGPYISPGSEYFVGHGRILLKEPGAELS